MNNGLEKLIDDKILSQEDISSIKTHLENNYKYCSSTDRAKLFSKRVTTLVDDRLSSLDDNYRALVKKNLIRMFATRNESQITNKHAFDEISVINEILWKDWINKVYGEDIKIRDLEKYIKQRDKPHSDSFFDKLRAIDLNTFKSYIDLFTPKLILSVLLLLLVFFTTLYGVMSYMNNININREHFISFVEFSDVLKTKSILTIDLDMNTSLLEIKDHSGYPDNFTFKAINTYKLKEYLITKNSKLLEENYINTVLNIAADFDINPLLLFSIIGQEQSYIPIDNEFADKIINNPYNVYGSWKEFNTTFEESTTIASKTIRNILTNRPVDEDPFFWLNQTYAEDPNWNVGVKYFYYKLLELTKL